MKTFLLVFYLVLINSSFTAFGSERMHQWQELSREYEEAVQEFRDRWLDKDYLERTLEERIDIYETWPAWKYIPRFLELAKAHPSDETAFECCLWIIERTDNVGNDDSLIFSADQKAWAILSAHHSLCTEVPTLCFKAANRDGPAQEIFLRELLKSPDTSLENRGFATLALAELLAQRHESSVVQKRRDKFLQKRPDAFASYLLKREDRAWKRHVSEVKLEDCKEKSILLFREVVRKYSDMPVTISEPSFRNLTNLGEKASKSLYALEHLSVGSKAPKIAGIDLNGKPLNLLDYNGHAVVLSFWFPECSPCIAMVPQEKKLIETYKGQRFALLGICRHEDRAEALTVANEHEMDWPCWYDGPKGPIVRDWNILSWPTVYVLDKNGVIVAKKLQGPELDDLVAELMQEESTD